MKCFTLSAALLSLVFGVAQSQASVLTFDDISAAPLGTIPNGYGGFNWSNMGYFDGSFYNNSGYENGIVSGTHVAYNESGAVGTASSGTFTFNSAYFTAAWNNGLNIQLDGYNSNVLLFSQTIVVNTTGPTLFNFNWAGIDELTFTSFGGVNAGLDGAGNHFAMDNFAFDEVTNTPEPATMALLGLTGLGGLGLRLRQRRNSKNAEAAA